MQSGQFGQAIANYHRSLKLDPSNHQARNNLLFAETKFGLAYDGSPTHGENTGSWASEDTFVGRIHSLNRQATNALGVRALWAMSAVASVVFWGLLIARALGYCRSIWRFAVVPALLLGMIEIALAQSAATYDHPVGVLVKQDVALREGDGGEFAEKRRLATSEGQLVGILARRKDWFQISLDDGMTGWIEATAIEPI